MPYYYSQVQWSNQQGISLSGISGTPTIRFKLATDYSAGIKLSTSNWYTCDGRWPGGSGTSYIYQNGGGSPLSAGIGNEKINGFAVSLSAFTTAAANDVLEYDATNTGTAHLIFNRYTLNEAADSLGIYELEVDDNNGTHIFDIAGTSAGSNIPDSLGLITATVENAPVDDSQWVPYSTGGAVTGTGDSVSGPSTSSGSGTGITIGSGASVSQPSSSSGTGTGVTTGTGASVSGPSTSAGTGLRVITGFGDSVSGPSTSSGTGGPGSAVVTGSGNSQSGPATSSGTGSGVTVGSGASVSGPATSTGVALRVITGSGSSQSGPATSSGTGGSVRVVTGSGNSVSGPSTSTGVGLRVITGSGNSVSGPATSEGSDRGSLPRPVINPGTVDISPLYTSAEIETEYGSIDIAPKYGTTDY